MCEECGCTATVKSVHVRDHRGTVSSRSASTTSIEVLTGLLHENDHVAAHNREHFKSHGVLVINLMSSPGSGKTSLLEATIDAIGSRFRISVIEGDLETENDAVRIRRKGVPAVQITTGQTCHLDANMIHDALHALDLAAIDILFIENVGNLVCPAGFDLGQHANVTLLSVTEGDDKPAKYPVMFRVADLVLLSKSDLLEVLGDFNPATAEANLRKLANPAEMLRVTVRQPETLVPWLGWLEQQFAACRSGQMSRAYSPSKETHNRATG
jgi:hydrogenase nickel incorporation protein HypB